MRRESIAAALGLAFALILSSCGATTPSAKTAPPKTVKVTIAEASKSPTMSTADVIARAQGFFADEGLEVEILHMSGGAEALMIMGTGDAHFGVMDAASIPKTSLTPGLETIVLKPNTIGFGHQIIVQKDVAEKLGLKKDMNPKEILEKLKGRSFAVSSKSGGVAKTAQYLLERHGFPSEKYYDWAYVGGTAARVAAFQTKAVDVTMLPSRMQSQPLIDAGAFMAIDVKNVSPFNEMYNTVFFTTKKYMNANPDVARRMVKALVRAHDFAFQNPQEAIKILQDYFKDQKPADVALAYNEDAGPLHPRNTKSGYQMSGTGWQELVKMATAIGEITEPVDTKEGLMWTNAYLPK